VIHAADGNIPSDMATGSTEQIEEERRLFYVALTRAKKWLYVTFPLRYFHAARGRFSDRHGYAQLTRFISKRVKPHFHCRVATPALDLEETSPTTESSTGKSIRRRSRAMWS